MTAQEHLEGIIEARDAFSAEVGAEAERAVGKLREHEAVRRGLANVVLADWQDEVDAYKWPGYEPDDRVTVDGCTIVVQRPDGEHVDDGFNIRPDSPETVRAGVWGDDVIELSPREAADDAIEHYTPILDGLLRPAGKRP